MKWTRIAWCPWPGGLQLLRLLLEVVTSALFFWLSLDQTLFHRFFCNRTRGIKTKTQKYFLSRGGESNKHKSQNRYNKIFTTLIKKIKRKHKKHTTKKKNKIFFIHFFQLLFFELLLSIIRSPLTSHSTSQPSISSMIDTFHPFLKTCNKHFFFVNTNIFYGFLGNSREFLQVCFFRYFLSNVTANLKKAPKEKKRPSRPSVTNFTRFIG